MMTEGSKQAKSLEESIIESLDGGGNKQLLPFLPYLLQDLWEIGSDPGTMLTLIKRHIDKDIPRILDLGCGKGAVSIRIASELDCDIHGIDAIPDFIESARDYAIKHDVQNKCRFEVGDIRLRIKDFSNIDVIILGAIGPVLGDMAVTLFILRQALSDPGYVLLDDAYLDDDSISTYGKCLRKSAFFGQIREAGFRVVDEELFPKEHLHTSDHLIFESIERRARELMARHPGKQEIFQRYLVDQAYENQVLENEITTGTWLLRSER